MAVNWCNQRELTFLECLQAEPVLWNIKLKDYKNKMKNHDAWMRISAIMEISVDELKKKKESLMSSYRSYKNRVKKSIKSGAGVEEVYQPIWFAYETMDSFLGDTLNSKKTINTESVNNEEEEEQEENSENMEEQQNESRSTNTPNESQSANNQNKTIRRRQNPSELVDAGKVVKEALVTFQNAMKSKESMARPPPSQDDDCDLYGKLLAKKLRKLTDQKKLRIMHDIDGLFIRYQYEQYPSPAPSPSPVRSPLEPCSFNFNQNIRSQPFSTIMDPRPGTSSSSHSEPPIHYAPVNSPSNIIIHSNELNQNIGSQTLSTIMDPRPGTSSSLHSEPPIHYAPVNSPSNIIIHSNELIPATNYPVLHIPEQNSNTASRNIVITSNTELNSLNSVNLENNIIHKAFNLR